ncbi:MAG: tetratricopeptide repeat protein [Bacteroidales bacterium]|nr:tetratricopeptide repeat protein [Bacteroidales bacterium]MCF8402979.1 tetratricopeptide repeat protein [Bacteroidales bacterium]
MKQVILSILFLAGVYAAFASTPDSLFQKANLAYSNGYYSEATDTYIEIVNSGYESADLYFNLGNTYFKMEDFPSAIFYYEKAKKLAPNNEDVSFNLEIANSKIIDKIEPVPEIFFKSWWRSINNLFSSFTWTIIFISGFFLFFVFLAFYLLSSVTRIRKLAFFIGLIIFVISVFSLLIAYQKYQVYKNDNYAIVFAPTITVKSSPNSNSVDLFVIHEGSKVQVRDKVGEWIEIRIANGSVGWLPENSLKKI